MKKAAIRFTVLVALGLMLSLSVQADTVTFLGKGTGTNANLAATVVFQTSGNNLIVTLTNTSTSPVNVPAQVLTALFFTLSGNPTLTPVSAMLASGSSVLNCTSANGCTAPSGGNVGGEWAYATFNSSLPGGAHAGISSTGVNLFGNGNFNGPNLQGPKAVDGMQFGIVSPSTTVAGLNSGAQQNAFIQNSVVFTLSGLPNGYLLAGHVSNVSFQYGTALTEPNIPGNPPPPLRTTPEPGTLAMFGTGLFGVATLIRRRAQKSGFKVESSGP